MRDISNDLQERLLTVEGEITQLRTRLAGLEERKKAIRALLDAESAQWPQQSTHQEIKPRPITTKKLSDIAMELFSKENAEWSGDAIAKYAQKQGFDFNGSSPGRVTHFTLVGMAKSGLIEGLGDGRWRFKVPPEDQDASW